MPRPKAPRLGAEDYFPPEPVVYDLEVDTDALVTRLQKKWLLTMERLFDTGAISSADLATLEKFLSRNGWTVDPTKLPSKLRDKLVNKVKLDDMGHPEIAGYIGERTA